jgi:hypothetical protein
VGDRDGAVLHPDLVGVGMVAVMMRIEREANGLGRLRLDLRHDFERAGRIVGVEDEDAVLEDHPTGVAVPLPLQVSLVRGSRHPAPVV